MDRLSSVFSFNIYNRQKKYGKQLATFHLRYSQIASVNIFSQLISTHWVSIMEIS